MQIAVLTSGRQDWGILRSTCIALREDPSFDLHVVAGGMHLSDAHGHTIDQIVAAGFSPSPVAWAMGPPASHECAGALSSIGDALDDLAPDALLLVGDRFETMAAAVAAALARLPIVHLHGGEETSGAIDDALRHAITKLSHLHLVSHPSHAERVRRLGEAPETIHVVGAPGLDNVHRNDLPTTDELADQLGFTPMAPTVVVTVHPETLATDPVAAARAAADAMDLVEATYVVTLPNTDPANDAVRLVLREACRAPGRVMVEALGDAYWTLLSTADAVLGNSSSALIEAPVLRVPAVNIGDRQSGRLRGDNVIDVPSDATQVAAALKRCLDPGHRATLTPLSPYGDGRSADRILDVLRAWTPPRPPRKAPT